MTWRETQRRQRLREIRATNSPKTRRRKKPKTTKPPRGGTSTDR